MESLQEPIRLQKYLARSGVASRRASEVLIAEGRVKVNGRVVTEMGTKVVPSVDEVRLDDAVVSLHTDHTTLMLHKPAGYLTSMRDPRGRPCVAELVPCDRYPGLFPVGRLDFDTTGLLLFSTDGQLGNALLHPSHQVNKTYEAWVEGCPSEKSLQRLRQGLQLDDGPTQPAHVERVACRQNETLVRLTIHEGRKRQVKRMMAAVGHPVVRLHRKRFGPLELGDLPCGQYRELTQSEVEALVAAL